MKQFQESNFMLALMAAGIMPAYGEGDGGEGDGGEGDGGEGGEGGEKPQMTDKEAELLKENMKKKEKLKEVSGQLETLQGENSTIKSELSDLKAAMGDLDAEGLKSLVEQSANAAAEADKAKKEKLKADGKWEELENSLRAGFESEKSQILEQHQSVIQERETEITSLKEQLGQLSTNVEELAVGRSFSDSPLISEKTVMSPNIARTLFGAHVDVVDGAPVAYDKARGEDSRARLVDGEGKPLAFDEAMKRLIDAHPDKDRLWKAEGSPGASSGGKGGKGSGNEGSDGGDKKLSGQEKISQGLSGLLKKS